MRALVEESWASGIVGSEKLGDDRRRQHFPELHTPLVEAVDTPHDSLHKRPVFVERDQLAEYERCEARTP